MAAGETASWEPEVTGMLPGVITPVPVKAKVSRVPCPRVIVSLVGLNRVMAAVAPTVMVTVSVVASPAGLVTVRV